MGLSDELAALLGPSGWLTGADTEPYRRDWLNRYGEEPLGVARPATTAEVSAVMAACHAAGVPVVPQGGNTGLCGSGVAGAEGWVILSLSRMAAIGAVDRDSASIEVEAGAVLAQVHATLTGSGLDLPMHLGAEGSARIGGLIGTNAGGSQAFRHGMMGDLVLGLEVVLADGTIWDSRRAVLKDNAGYQLKRLFAGSEGTLGVVTRAVLRLTATPRARQTALLAVPSAEALVALGVLLRAEAQEFLAGMEFFCELGLDLTLRHVAGVSFPLESRAPFYLLVELATTSAFVPLEAIMEGLLERAMEEGLVSDGALAASEAQRLAFWRLREEQPEGQRLEGPQLKHDLSVPVGRIPDFLRQGADLCEALCPGVRINPFGHLGDGNIHYNLSPATGAADFRGMEVELGLSLARLAQEAGGSFAAEHGLGRSKIALADHLRAPQERALMRAVKQALDPKASLNPGVILRPKQKE
ncbi:FAD-binding oxidoreductase [Pararhodobacter sp. CCB-MM2]|uniref:FAD-binding oxidoreductase n=1 Tax=Pararhodobacter sp. CCB-MM2 TaxID=1786003 RepID=UPI0009F6365E|nr:FAD-binding oxidoreductase [Pararhodobacter sp. CCB-MM2]